MFFTRPDGQPAYRDRRLAVVLAQGAARHYIDGRTGVKDLDVWTFYASIAGRRFPADRRETHADFGPSDLGRQLYRPAEARSPREAERFRRWQSYAGRRVDLLMRAIPPPEEPTPEAIYAAIREWLTGGQRRDDGSSPAHLARKAMIIIDPEPDRGRTIWPLA
jgi:hypothetical protein